MIKMDFKYKEIDGYRTCWKGQDTKLYQRVIYKLYKKYINIPFVPKESTFIFKEYPTMTKKKGIETIIINSNGKEHYVFTNL